MKTQSNYQNRYGDVYTFTKQEDNTILWEGPFEYYRVGFAPEEERITMVDPSGGPYIAEGMPFRYLGGEQKITRLEWLDKAVKITVE